MSDKPSMSHDASLDALGAAIDRCRGYTPDCLHFGICEYEGDCFRSEKQAVIDARRAILSAADGIESEDVAELVRKAARLLVAQHNELVGAITAPSSGTGKGK